MEKFLIVADYREVSELTVEEMAIVCRVSMVVIQNLIDYGIISLSRAGYFDANEVPRAQAAMRLHRDLELNWSGVALVMDLLQELEQFRAMQNVFNKHFLK